MVVLFHYMMVQNGIVQCTVAEFVWPPRCNMKDLALQKLGIEYRWLNILLEEGFISTPYCYEVTEAIFLRLKLLILVDNTMYRTEFKTHS